MSGTERLLRELIALPSVNPAFLPEKHAHAGEQRVAEFLGATGASAGLDIRFDSVIGTRANLIASLSPRGKVASRILLAPHLDTVNVASESQLTPAQRNGRIYGRGACDTKGPAAAMFSAICELARFGERPARTEIVFAGLIDEEEAQAGSRALAKSKFRADLAIVGEPTRLKVVTAHKGSMWLEMVTTGRAAHGACPELGINAVHRMARIVDLLQTDYAKQLKRRTHPLLGAATVSVGAICGGTQANIVPDQCTIRVDRRTLPGESHAGVIREVKALLSEHGLSASISDGKAAPCLPMETNAQNRFVTELMRQAGVKKPQGVHYFCDASILAHAGIPSIVFGPGDIAQAHTADEWIDLDSLEQGREILARFLRALP